MTYMAIWWHSPAACVDFIPAKGGEDPVGKVFDETLVELMEDVRSNGTENVDIGKVFPKGMIDRLDSGIETSACKVPQVRISSVKGFKNCHQVPGFLDIAISQFIFTSWASWTIPVLQACHKNLLRVIACEYSKDRMASMNVSIACCHFKTMDSHILQWGQDTLHTDMEQIC